MSEAVTVRLDFDEDDPNKAAVVAAFQETGLPLHVQPDRPTGVGQRGGGAAFFIDLLVQHLPALGDGLIAAATWAALSKAAQVLKGRYDRLRVQANVTPYPTGEDPLPLNISVLYVFQRDDELDLQEVGRDLDAVVHEAVKSYESQKASGEWVSYRIEISRRPRSIDPNRPF